LPRLSGRGFLGGLLCRLRLQAYSVDSIDWQALLGAIGGRKADVMVEAKGKEHALSPICLEIG
jgi:hypothetical protein